LGVKSRFCQRFVCNDRDLYGVLNQRAQNISNDIFAGCLYEITAEVVRDAQEEMIEIGSGQRDKAEDQTPTRSGRACFQELARIGPQVVD